MGSDGKRLRRLLVEALEGMSSLPFSVGVILTPVFASIGAVDSDGVGFGFQWVAAEPPAMAEFKGGGTEFEVSEKPPLALLPNALCVDESVAAPFCECESKL